MKKKGFTLIELLAVIVILAIIALIATPIILNIISDSKEESEIEKRINEVDPMNMTPMEALNFIYELKKEKNN